VLGRLTGGDRKRKTVTKPEIKGICKSRYGHGCGTTPANKAGVGARTVKRGRAQQKGRKNRRTGRGRGHPSDLCFRWEPASTDLVEKEGRSCLKTHHRWKECRQQKTEYRKQERRGKQLGKGGGGPNIHLMKYPRSDYVIWRTPKGGWAGKNRIHTGSTGSCEVIRGDGTTTTSESGGTERQSSSTNNYRQEPSGGLYWAKKRGGDARGVIKKVAENRLDPGTRKKGVESKGARRKSQNRLKRIGEQIRG